MSVIMECHDLTKSFNGLMALNGVNFSLGTGRIVGLLGPNGSGKTTLLKIANGLIQPTHGEILLDGKKPGPETKSFVSYLPDANYLMDWMKVKDLVNMFCDFYPDFDKDRAYEMLRSLRISGSLVMTLRRL